MNKTSEQAVLDRVLSDDYLAGNFEYSLNFVQRFFYKLKLIICILFGFYADAPEEDGLTVMCVEYKRWYYGWDAEFVSVGLGLFKNWYYTFYSDGDCCI